MAERRSLHQKISRSTDIADLMLEHGPYAALFVTWAIPHLDRFGCLPADARKLRVTVIPMVDEVTSGDIAAWVEWLVDRGLVRRVTGPEGDEGIQFVSFHKLQAGARLERERPSLYEPHGWMGDATEVERLRARGRMKNHRERQKEGADMQGTPGELPDNSGRSLDVRAYKEKRREEKRNPPYPPNQVGRTHGGGRENGAIDVRVYADQLVEQQLREEAEREETHE